MVLADSAIRGLGIGTSVKGIIAHGINTTVVELDPGVHDLAIKYFDLPPNHTAVIQNAVPFVNKAAAVATERYDYIIHDVFTGGAEPVSLFTLEFLTDLRTLLKDDGVVAINYAGDVALPSTHIVFHTIHTVFPNCRLFRDNKPSSSGSDSVTDPLKGVDFVNMVLFCTKSENKGVTFRAPTDADFRDSVSLRNHLAPDPQNELPFPPALSLQENIKLLRHGATQDFDKHQANGALKHWAIMRSVLPDAVWENW